MTVSRLESELAILREIAEGDGDEVHLKAVSQRDVIILKELISNQCIRGQMLLSGDGCYVITARGETRLDNIQKQLLAEEILNTHRSTLQLFAGWVWRRKKAIFVAASAFVGFVWIILSQVLAPTRYCAALPEEISSWFAPCETVLKGVNP